MELIWLLWVFSALFSPMLNAAMVWKYEICMFSFLTIKFYECVRMKMALLLCSFIQIHSMFSIFRFYHIASIVTGYIRCVDCLCNVFVDANHSHANLKQQPLSHTQSFIASNNTHLHWANKMRTSTFSSHSSPVAFLLQAAQRASYKSFFRSTNIYQCARFIRFGWFGGLVPSLSFKRF